MAYLKMATAALKNLFSKPACLMYPLQSRKTVVGSRGKLEINIAKCIYCGLCQRKCPAQAIEVVRIPKAKPGEPEATGKSSWTLNRLRCVSCNACVEVCPTKCLKLDHLVYPAAVRKKSTETHTNA
jgi:ech hydrogenase subunit F